MIDYFILAVGMSILDQPLDRPWWWQQPQYSHTQYEQSNTFGLGVGRFLNPRTRLELTYRDLGRYSGFLAWEEPERVVDDPNTECVEPCTKTFWGFNTGSVRGVELAVARQYGYLSFTAGGFAHRSEWRHYRSDINNDHARTYGLVVKSVKYGLTPMLGVAVSYGHVELGWSIYFEVPSDEVCCSPWRSAYALTITLRGNP